MSKQSMFGFFVKETIRNTGYTLAATAVGTAVHHFGMHVYEEASDKYTMFKNTLSKPPTQCTYLDTYEDVMQVNQK